MLDHAKLVTRRRIMKVRDVMTEKVNYCLPETTLAEAAAMMWDHDCGALPVVIDDAKVIGMITDRDIAIAAGTKARPAFDIPVKEAMSQALYACSPNDDIHAALNTMSNDKVRRLPVLDAEGNLKGILSMNDIILFANKDRKKDASDLAYEDIVKTYKAICEHRSFEEPVKEQKLLTVSI
jgi:CBS domain-containing protein